MRGKWSIVLSALWNCAGKFVGVAVGFVVAPFLIHRLGETVYGLWTVIAALTAYFGLLELGVRRSVGRFIAYHHAQGSPDKVNATVSTALAILGSLGIIACGGVLSTLFFFFDIFDVPPDQVEAAKIALALVAINLALTLVLDVFDATLWGLQRFDLINGIEIPTSIVRALLTFWFIGTGGGLVALAIITVGLTLAQGLVKIYLAFRSSGALRIGPSRVTRESAREIFGYGLWNFIASIVQLTRTSLSPVLVGATLGVAVATAFSIASRLTMTAMQVLNAATDVVIPWATAKRANNDKESERMLFLTGGRYCTALALYFTALLVILGGPLINLWIGPQLLYAVPLLVLMTLGETLPNSQYVSGSMIFAAARHQSIAWLGVAEAISMAVLMIALVGPLGLFGVGLALAIPGTAFRGIGFMVKGCQIAEVSWTQYLREAILPPIVSSIPPVALLALVSWWRPAVGWVDLFLYGGAFSVLFGAACLAWMERETVGRIWNRLLRRKAPDENADSDPSLEVVPPLDEKCAAAADGRPC